ncbi:phage portal protein [Candidatus Kaiserbacteria bacterium]|nr:phage portal protein [Candidatus Kaiserbacteria bacterium]
MLGQLASRITANGRTSSVTEPISKEHRARRDLFARYWNYYRGNHKQNIKVMPGQADDNVTLNYSKKIVNQGVNFLFGKEPFFDLDSDTEQRTPGEQYLDKTWADDPLNNFSAVDFLQGVAMNGGITGTPFIRLYPAGDMREEVPTMVAINPATVDVTTDPDDMSRILEYRIVWQSGKAWKQDRFAIQDNGTWEIVREVNRMGNKWETEGEAVTWAYNWAPLFHCQNLKNPLDFWGISDLEDADLNDGINFTASNNNRILRFHAHPKTIAVGVEATQIQTTAVDQLWAIPAQGANVFNLEMQSDLASSRQHLSDLKQDFHNISDVPMMDTITTNVGALSGFALRILYGPLISKTESKRRRYGGMLARLNYAILELGDFEPQVCSIRWQDPLPADAKEKAELFEILARSTKNIYAAAKTAGYSEAEAQRLAEARRLTPADYVSPASPSSTAIPQDAAPNLNGAQIRAILDVLANVRNGSTPKQTARELIVAVGVTPQSADTILAGVNEGGPDIVTAN